MTKPVLLVLTIAYDGGAYAGWQVQKTGVGVQEKVWKELGLKNRFQLYRLIKKHDLRVARIDEPPNS